MDKKHKITLRLDDSQHKVLNSLCEKNKQSQNDLMIKLINKELNNKEKCNPITFMVSNEDAIKLSNYLKENPISKNNLLSLWINNIK